MMRCTVRCVDCEISFDFWRIAEIEDWVKFLELRRVDSILFTVESLS